jgi:Flp pilus assembly protein TadB
MRKKKQKIVKKLSMKKSINNKVNNKNIQNVNKLNKISIDEKNDIEKKKAYELQLKYEQSKFNKKNESDNNSNNTTITTNNSNNNSNINKNNNHKIKKSIKKNQKKSYSQRNRWLNEHLEKAGIETELVIINMFINRISLTLALIYSIIYFLYDFSLIFSNFFWLFFITLVVFIISFAGLLIFCHVVFWIYVDLKKFQRKLMIEEVLPDFFQLASANIKAGMPIDKALWFAVRPRFGVLAKEIELVAKKTLSGADLHDSLIEFANKYDSKLVLRSVYLLNEGIKAGGNVGDLLNKISTNIQELKTMKKEMAASVMTYVIFITFAAIVAAPILFALSDQLLNIVQGIADNVEMSSGDMPQTGSVGISMNISSDNINPEHFKIFVYTCLLLSSIFSSMIVSTIQKGNAKEGLQYIPIFIIVSFIIFLSASFLLGMLFSEFF